MSKEQEKDKVISLFLDGMGPTQMFRQLAKDGVKISRKDMNNIVYNYLDSLPKSIDDVDTTNMNSGQIDNLKIAIHEKLGIDTRIQNFEAMREEVSKLRFSMGKLYPERLYAPEIELIANSVRYALSVGVPRYLIKKRLKNVSVSVNLSQSKSKNGWSTKKVNGYRGLRPGVY